MNKRHKKFDPEFWAVIGSMPDFKRPPQYSQYVVEKIRRGIERTKIEGAVSHEDVKKRLSKWIEI